MFEKRLSSVTVKGLSSNKLDLVMPYGTVVVERRQRSERRLTIAELASGTRDAGKSVSGLHVRAARVQGKETRMR